MLNNFVAAASFAATRQALSWAEDLELDHNRLLALMHDSSGQTWFGTNFDDIEFAKDRFSEMNTLGILAKDVSAALDAVADPNNVLGTALIDTISNLGDYRSG